MPARADKKDAFSRQIIGRPYFFYIIISGKGGYTKKCMETKQTS